MRAGPVEHGRPKFGASLALRTLAGAALAACLVYLALAFVTAEREAAVDHWRHHRESAADSRVAAIGEWVALRLGDAVGVATLPPVRRLLSAGAASGTGDVVPILTSVLAGDGARHAFVVDAGRRLAARDTRPGNLEPGCLGSAAPVLATGEPAAAFHRHADGSVAVTFAAPVRGTESGGRPGPVLGAIVVAEDPGRWLYHYLSLRHGETQTAESVLVRRDGGDVLYLSPVRHDPAPPLTLRRPLTTPGLAAAEALGGREAFGAFRDYRGVPVVAAIRPIARTDWALVAKVDRDEVLGPFQARMWRDGATAGAVLLAFLGLAVVARRSQRATTAARMAQAEARLNEGFKIAAQSMSDVVYEWDLGDRIEWLGDVDGLTGHAPGEYPRTVEGWAATLHPEDRDRIVAITRRHLQDPGPLSHDVEYRVRKKDGAYASWRVRGRLIRDADGRPARWIGAATDVTERKGAEEALRASERKYKHFFEQDLAGHYVSTPDGRVTACNAAFARILGFASAEDALGADLASCHTNPRAREEFLRRLEAEGRVDRLEMEVRRRDATATAVIESAVSVRDDGGGLREIHGFLVDDAERKRAEAEFRQAQKMEAVGRLAGGVAHDFNNLLGVILGWSELLLVHRAEGDPERAQLEQVRKAAERGARLTRQLLAFSRKQVLQPRVLDLSRLVREMEPMLRRLIGEDVRLVTVLPENLGRVRADEGQIEQVLMNLVVNSRDAMPRGGTLTLETSQKLADDPRGAGHAEGGPGSYVELSVSDTGCGMDAPTLAHLFEPFFTTKEAGQGTGLGLATVYGVVTQSGGHVEVASSPGEGATFRVRLPMLEGSAEPAPAGARGASLLGGSATVLVLEDDEGLRSVAQEILEVAGYHVLVAALPDEAHQTAVEHPGPIDLLVSDVVMPGRSGPELAAEVRALRPGIRILFISGYADDAIARHGILDKGHRLLPKPFSPQALLLAVRATLDDPVAPPGDEPAGA